MEIRVGIVEDEKIIRNELKRVLVLWEEMGIRKYDIKAYDFDTAEDFLKSDYKFDIVFLDIELEEKESGLKAAQTLREWGDYTPIVFLTSYREKMFFGYKVHALDFLVKPVRQDEVNWCMNQIVSSLDRQYYIHDGKQSFKIRYSDILYFMADYHYVNIVTLKGTFKKMISMKQIQKELPEEFIQCHRSYIVNVNQILSLQKKEIMVSNGDIIGLSDKYRDETCKAYMKFLPK